MARHSAERSRTAALGAGLGCVLVALWLMAAGCDGQTVGEGSGDPAGPEETVRASDAADGGNRGGEPEPPTQESAPRPAAGPSRVGATFSAAAVPFGDADLHLGARDEPGAVVIWPGLGDARGALGSDQGAKPHFEPDALGRVLDLCVREEAHAGLRGTILEPGEPMDYEALIWVRNSQSGLGCYGEPKSEDPGGRWFYLTPGGSSGYFETREQALQWRQDQREEYRNTLSPWEYPMGFINNAVVEFIDKPGDSVHGIRYSDADDPIDEVRLLAESVAVRDGVLRGLVRNWSRALWAYGVTVSAGGKSWRWPLSIQPGGVAPFEIEGWDGPQDPDQIDLAVAAQMSPKADLSRSYEWYNQKPLPPERMPDLEQFERDHGYEPGIVRLVDAERWMTSTAKFRVPASHPSFADHIGPDERGRMASVGQAFTADELVSYLAYMQLQVPEGGDLYEDGRSVVFEVVEQPVFWSPDDMDVHVIWFGSGYVSDLAWLGLPDPHTR
ncbi:hypothetical protein [Candidatus Poriferisodalis sp.]|uniref:hypothetical protein n=1 Tax=Candidatus Poriferisodalis sp. TaxID=3101277 RepID=UPI003D11A0D8